MASKIQSHNFYVAITPYKVQGVEDQYNELSVFTDYNQYTHKFYVSLHAGWKSTFGHGSMIMGDSNPLTASTRVYVKESPRNSQKTINEIGAALELAKADIAWLFDERMFTQLQQFVKDVALCGYNENLKSQISNLKNQKNTTMANEAFKAADLIGKVIIVGNNQGTITVKGVQDNGMLSCEFKKTGDTATTPMTVTMPNLQKMTERGLWKLQTSEVTTEADVQEVQDIVPVVTPKAASERGQNGTRSDSAEREQARPEVKAEEPKEEKPADKVERISKPKQEKTTNPTNPTNQTNEPKPKTKPEVKAASEREQNGARTSSAEREQARRNVKADGTLTYETYTSSKGKPCARIMGFKETDAAYQNAADIHGSHSWITSKDGRVLYVAFGPKYAAKAKEVCDALNAGKSFEDCKAIMDGRTAGEAKTYTAAEVVDLIQRMAKKDPKALAEYEAMLQAA